MEGVKCGGGDPVSARAPVPSSRVTDKGKRDEWSEEGVLCLLEVYESKWRLRNRAKLKGSDWEDIARLVSGGCSGPKALKTANQCKNKIESMKKRYRAESAAVNDPSSCSSWQFYARMDDLLKGTVNSPVQLKSIHDIDLQALPKMEVEVEAEAEVEADGQVRNSIQDDGSNTVPIDHVNAKGNDANNNKNVARVLESNLSASKSKVAMAGDDGNLSKRRKGGEGSSAVAESIRLLAQSMVKIEQVRLEMAKDSERMRAEAEIKRGEMELKKTEIIAKTQLQIAEIFARRMCRRKHGSNSLRIDEEDA